MRRIASRFCFMNALMSVAGRSCFMDSLKNYFSPSQKGKKVVLSLVFALIVIWCICIRTGVFAQTTDSVPVLRYVNIAVLADTLTSEDTEWRLSIPRYELLAQKLLTLQANRKNDEPGDEERAVRSEMGSYDQKKEMVRVRVYNLINRAVEIVAKRNDITIVLNYTESVIYADPSFDITGEVLLEARKERERNSRLSR